MPGRHDPLDPHAGGGDQYAMFKGWPNVLKTKLTDSGVLRGAIESAKTIAPKTDGRIRRTDTPADAKPCSPTPRPTPSPTPTPHAAASPGGR